MNLMMNDNKEILAYKQVLERLKECLVKVLKHYKPVMNGEIYLSGPQICKMLHISKRTLQQYRDDEILPFIQIGGKIIFKQSDILKTLEQNYSKRK